MMGPDLRTCKTPGCPGDGRYEPPGRGHNFACTEAYRAALAVGADHPHTDPGDGRPQCPICGKWVWPFLHSCKGVRVAAPVDPAPELEVDGPSFGDYWPADAPEGQSEGSDDRQCGLYGKYQVERLRDPSGKHAECRYFVLDPQHDSFAGDALRAYAGVAEAAYPELAKDIREWLRVIGCCPGCSQVRGHRGVCPAAPAPVLDDEVEALTQALLFGAKAGDLPAGRLFRESIARRLLASDWLAAHTAAAVDAALAQQREGLAEAIEGAVLDATFRSRDFSDGFWHGTTYAARIVREFGEGR